MLPVIPAEILMGSWELICCMLTSLAAFLSYVLFSGQ